MTWSRSSAARGLLRITIDLPWVAPVEVRALPVQFVTVEDCER